jgi:hypothetical protein
LIPATAAAAAAAAAAAGNQCSHHHHRPIVVIIVIIAIRGYPHNRDCHRNSLCYVMTMMHALLLLGRCSCSMQDSM